MLKDILERIDKRLKALNLSESRACVQAGLSDSAIRDMRRAVKAGLDRGTSSKTLFALAPVLETTAVWLLDECGPEHVTPQMKWLIDVTAKADPEQRARIMDFAEFQTGVRRPQDLRETAA